MKWIIFLLMMLLWSSVGHAYQMIYNPFTSKLDFVGVSSGTLPSGSTQYIQNTLTPTTSTQSFAVAVGSFSSTGWYIMDSASCVWQTTINLGGGLVTSRIGCSLGSILMENGTYILQEDGTRITLE